MSIVARDPCVLANLFDCSLAMKCDVLCIWRWLSSRPWCKWANHFFLPLEHPIRVASPILPYPTPPHPTPLHPWQMVSGLYIHGGEGGLSSIWSSLHQAKDLQKQRRFSSSRAVCIPFISPCSPEDKGEMSCSWCPWTGRGLWAARWDVLPQPAISQWWFTVSGLSWLSNPLVYEGLLTLEVYLLCGKTHFFFLPGFHCIDQCFTRGITTLHYLSGAVTFIMYSSHCRACLSAVKSWCMVMDAFLANRRNPPISWSFMCNLRV